ncbi:MAG: O-antigen ligase family protein [Elusimicrobia bacterium]|nr:O-antigen ligase family protein [Elusimicrobiota bacterium]
MKTAVPHDRPAPGPSPEAPYEKTGAGLAQTAGLAVFAAALPLSVTLIQGGMLLFIAAGLWRKRRDSAFITLPGDIRRNPLFIPWAVYLAAGLAASLSGVSPLNSIAALNSDLLTFLAFAALCLFLEPQRRGLVLKFYLAGLCAAAALGVGQALYGLLNAQDVRAHATSHPVRFGEIMVIGLALVLSRLAMPGADTPRVKKFLCAAALLLFSAIILSQTRSAYLGAVMVFAALFILRRPPLRAVAVSAALVIALTAGLSTLDPAVKYKLASIVRGENNALSAGLKVPDFSVSTRLELWRTGFEMIKDRPVFGAGPSNVKRLFPGYFKKPYPEGKIWGSLHNLYIHQAAERGLAGLGALLLLFAAMFAQALRNFRARPSGLTLWVLVLLPAWYVMNLTEVSFQHVHTSYAVLLAMAVSITASGAE